MSFTLSEIAADAGRLWRRERALLLPVAGLFYFLPALALLLLLPQPEAPADPASDAAGEALIAYATDNAGAILGANLANIVGAMLLLLLFLGRPRPTMAEAFRRGATLFPAFLLVVLAMWAMLFVGAFLILPAFYLIGRFFLVTSVAAAEGPQGPVRAMARSFELTRGRGWLLFVLAAAVFVAGQLLVTIAGTADRALIAGGMGSPPTFILFNALAAFASAGASVLTLLMKVAVYRRVTGSSNGM